jgi:hypothetical protein
LFDFWAQADVSGSRTISVNNLNRLILMAFLFLADATVWGRTPPPPESPYAPQKVLLQQPKDMQPDLEKPGKIAVETKQESEGLLDLSDRRLPQAPEMLGDLPPPVFSVVPVVIQLPPQFVQTITKIGDKTIINTIEVPGGTVVIPGGVLPTTSRGFKIADDGSARPQDRIYFDFNFFSDLFAATNLRLGNTIQNLKLYRESLSLEKTFLAGNASVGLRLPMNTVTMESVLPNLNGTHTALGDLSTYFRYALWSDPVNDNWLTAGLAVTLPTGPSAIGGLDAPVITHSTIFQPYLGALWNFGSIYLQGFFSVDTPTDSRDVTLLYTDLGVGYFLYRTSDWNRFLTGIAPTLEVHSSNPVNHRGPPSLDNPLSSFDLLDMGFGANIQFRGRYWLALQAVTPLTGPKPFTIEALAQFRIRY